MKSIVAQLCSVAACIFAIVSLIGGKDPRVDERVRELETRELIRSTARELSQYANLAGKLTPPEDAVLESSSNSSKSFIRIYRLPDRQDEWGMPLRIRHSKISDKEVMYVISAGSDEFFSEGSPIRSRYSDDIQREVTMSVHGARSDR